MQQISRTVEQHPTGWGVVAGAIGGVQGLAGRSRGQRAATGDGETGADRAADEIQRAGRGNRRPEVHSVVLELNRGNCARAAAPTEGSGSLDAIDGDGRRSPSTKRRRDLVLIVRRSQGELPGGGSGRGVGIKRRRSDGAGRVATADDHDGGDGR